MLYIPHFSTLPLQPPKMIPFSSLLAALRHQKLGNGPIVTVIFLPNIGIRIKHVVGGIFSNISPLVSFLLHSTL